MNRTALLYLFSLFAICSCGSDAVEEEMVSMQTYNIRVINGITEEAIPNLEVGFSWNFGSRSLAYLTKTTDQDGMVAIETSIDMDSVNSLLDTFPNANPMWVHQNININSDTYAYYECVQDTAMQIIRSRFVPDELITAKVFVKEPFQYSIVDIPPRRDRDLIVWGEFHQFHPAFSFDVTGSSFHLFDLNGSDTNTTNTSIADGVDYRIDFIITQYDTLNDRLDTLSVNPIEFTGDASVSDQGIVFEF